MRTTTMPLKAMPLQILYKVDSFEHFLPVRMDSVCDLLFKKYPEESEIIYGVNDSTDGYDAENPEIVSVSKVLSTIDKLLTIFTKDKELRMILYSFMAPFMQPPSADKPIYVSGNLSGVRLDNNSKHYYELESGYGKCSLSEVIFSDDDKSTTYGEIVDFRESIYLDTVNMGRIEFKKQKKPSLIVEDLKKLREFLAPHSEKNVEKYLM